MAGKQTLVSVADIGAVDREKRHKPLVVRGNAILQTAKDAVDALDPKIDGALTK